MKMKVNEDTARKMKIEIWIRGCKLCETENQEAIENFEQIVRKAGYTIEEKEENGKIIKII